MMKFQLRKICDMAVCRMKKKLKAGKGKKRLV